MKTILRTFLYSFVGLFITTLYVTTFDIKGGIQGLVYTSAVFGLLRLIVKPTLKIILFPLNILTFGVVSWIINVILLFLLVKITKFITISPWNFPGLSYNNIILSPYHLNYLETFIVTSLIIGIIVNLLMWLAD